MFLLPNVGYIFSMIPREAGLYCHHEYTAIERYPPLKKIFFPRNCLLELIFYNKKRKGG